MRESFESYVDAPGVNWTALKNMDVSPLAYRYFLDNDRPDTDALKAGRYVHAQVFEPDTVSAHYAVFPGEGTRATKEYKQFAAEHPGVCIFKRDEAEKLDAMVAAVRAHPLVRPYLAAPDGMFETSMRWTDAATELPCKGRADWLIPSRRALIDFKTAQSIDLRKFASAIGRYGYHSQLAHYKAGVTAALGWEPAEVTIIAVEKAAPYDIAVFKLRDDGIDDELLRIGAEKVAELLAKVKTCTDRNEWPGRYPAPVPLVRETDNMPSWLFGGDDDQIIYETEE